MSLDLSANTNVHFIRNYQIGAVELALSCAQDLDPSNKAAGYVKDGMNSKVRSRLLWFMVTFSCAKADYIWLFNFT